MRRFSLFQQIASLWSLIVGLKITGKYFFQKTRTVHYPRKTVQPLGLENYRGHIELVPKEDDPLTPKCITCMMCATSCPSGCYKVLKKKPPQPTPEELQAMKEAEAKGEKIRPKVIKEPGVFLYDYSLCSLCGICVENCPVDSLRFSKDVYVASTNKKDCKYDLLARLQQQAQNLSSDQVD